MTLEVSAVPPPTWIEQLAAELLDVAGELRQVLRTAKHDRAAPQHASTRRGRTAARTVTLSEMEARALLRGALPAPIAASRLARPHAQVNAAIALYSAHLLSLNQAEADRGHAIAAGLVLAEQLAAWLAAMRWQQATKRARRSWRQPVTAILRQSILGQNENNSLDPALSSIVAAAAATNAASPRALLADIRRQGPGARQVQATLDLASAAGAEIVRLQHPTSNATPAATPAGSHNRKAKHARA